MKRAAKGEHAAAMIRGAALPQATTPAPVGGLSTEGAVVKWQSARAAPARGAAREVATSASKKSDHVTAPTGTATLAAVDANRARPRPAGARAARGARARARRPP